MQHPDQKYINALINNDEAVIYELYEKFFETIKRMVLRNNGNREDAENIFQEALISILLKAKAPGFELTCPFEAYLYPVCWKKWLNELSKRKTHRVTFTNTEAYSNLGEDNFRITEDSKMQEERRNLIAEMLAKLSTSCQELLRLSWSGKSMEEVASILSVTYGYARKKKSKCMDRLITLVKDSPRFNSMKW